MTISDSLTLLASTKTAIAAAIENKGVAVGAIPFSQYPSKIAEISGGGGTPTPAPQPDPWVRPADWLPLPEITENDNMFVGLLAITNDEANYIALSAAGNYTVDWGDGTIENYDSNVTAQHYYDYNNTALVGTECSRGYRQAVVKVTPQSGATFTGINLQLRHSAMSAQIYNVQWLDLAMGGAALSDIRFAQSSASPFSTILIRIHWCEQVKIVRMSRTNMSYMFQNCYSLQSVPLFDTANVTDMTGMFFNCSSLQTVPLFDTANVTNMIGMFYNGPSLRTVPLFDTASVTNMSYMFSNCYSLQTVPLFDTASVTDMNSMFSDCYSLQSVPGLNAAGGTTTSMHDNMFTGCSSLASAPLVGTKFNVSYTNCKLSRSNLVAIFNGLADLTGGTARTITISGNFGAAQLTQADRDIALNKNWTITG